MSSPSIRDDQIVIFSSSAWRSEKNRRALGRLLEPQWRTGVDFHDVAVDVPHLVRESGDDLAVASEMRERIRFCDVFLLLAGSWPKDRKLVEREIAFAFALDKPIIPVAPYLRVRRNADMTDLATHEVVRWRGDALRGAIWRSLTPERREMFFDRLQKEKHELERMRANIERRRSRRPLGLPGPNETEERRAAPLGLPAASSVRTTVTERMLPSL